VQALLQFTLRSSNSGNVDDAELARFFAAGCGPTRWSKW
jgi:hypothetical protein